MLAGSFVVFQRIRTSIAKKPYSFVIFQGGGGSGPQGGTLIFSYIRRLGPFFGVKFLNFNIFWGFQKKIIFFGV